MSDGIVAFCGSIMLPLIVTPVFLFVSILDFRYINENGAENTYWKTF
jgi:hypothetical protein